jgi:hypothetical protein
VLLLFMRTRTVFTTMPHEAPARTAPQRRIGNGQPVRSRECGSDTIRSIRRSGTIQISATVT